MIWGVYFYFQDYRGRLIKKSSPSTLIREIFLNEVIATIEDEKFVSRSRSEDGGKGFTRNRKIHFVHLIILLTQGLSRSIQRELNSFYQKLQQSDFSIQHVTKGAFSRSRSKLKPEAFVELNQVGIKSFYTNAAWRNFRGKRLLAIDGSTAVLPTHRSVIKEFGTTNFGIYADSPRCIGRISVLYDVLNLTVLDAQIGSYKVSERELATKHFDVIEPGNDLIVFDRGYPSISLMFEMQAKGIDYLIRMRDDWLEVRKMLSQGDKDKEVTFNLSVNDKDLLKQYNTTCTQVKCRLVCVDLPDGGKEMLCTSILSKEILPYECFRELYHYRWNIEEAYKIFKNRLNLEAFSGKTAIAVKQDFFAKIFTMTTMAVLTLPIDEQLKEIAKSQSQKHSKKVNKTNALAMLKEITVHVFINKILRQALEAFDKIMKATVEIVRPNRKVTRKKRQKKPPSMNYKQL